MEINYLAVLACAVASMVIGSIWYGVLFKKGWMEVMGVDMSKMSPQECKDLQKGMGPTYFAQFVLSIVTAGVLSYVVSHWGTDSPARGGWAPNVSALFVAIYIWLGFILPTVGGAALWSGKPKKLAWKMFLIVSSAQLVTFIIFGIILNMF
jgi:hypothetical protein